MSSTIPLSSIITTLSTAASNTKHQTDQQYNGLPRDDDDDDISLAKCMTRKLQLNQQTAPSSMSTLHQQHGSPTSHDPTYTINKYTYTQYHQLQLQLQYQQQLMLQYQQQQQQQQNLTGYHGPLLGQHQHHRHQQQNMGTKHQSIVQKSKLAQLNADHHPKTRMPSATSSHRISWPSPTNTSLSSTKKSINDSQRQRHSILSLQSDCTTENQHSQCGSQQVHQKQQRRKASPSIVPAANQMLACGSTTASKLAPTSESTSVSKNHNKLPLSKRIRCAIMGKNTNKQAPTASSSAASSLRRSSSATSAASSVVTTKTTDNGINHPRSLWTTLLRKTSKSGPPNHNVEKQFVHGKHSNGQKDAVPDSPASSISGGSYHQSRLHQEYYFGDELPSPASSTSPELPLNYSADPYHPGNHPNSIQRIESNGQLDYFALSSPASKHQQSKNSPYTHLQHESPRLHLISNNLESDHLPTCFLDTPIHSNSTPVIVLPPISSSSSSATTSTSTLALDSQQRTNLKPAIKSFSTKPNAKIQFATTMQIHDTFGSQEYDRRCDTQVTCQRLTMALALKIKRELNEYKLNEMEVHVQSRKNTQFFL